MTQQQPNSDYNSSPENFLWANDAPKSLFSKIPGLVAAFFYRQSTEDVYSDVNFVRAD